MNSPSSVPDHVRSFVKRKGHFSDSRRAAMQNAWPQFGIAYDPTSRIDFSAEFRRSAPVVMEIGFGMGITTAAIAERNPEIDYLGIEVYAAGVASLMKLISDRAINNIRAIQHDVFDVVRDMLLDESLSGIHIYFPDPWPKARHHKRRLIQADFIQMLRPKLNRGGYIHCATDWEPYAQQMHEVLSTAEGFRNTVQSPFAPRPESRPLTKFEDRGLKLGHGVWDLIYRKT